MHLKEMNWKYILHIGKPKSRECVNCVTEGPSSEVKEKSSPLFMYSSLFFLVHCCVSRNCLMALSILEVCRSYKVLSFCDNGFCTVSLGILVCTCSMFMKQLLQRQKRWLVSFHWCFWIKRTKYGMVILPLLALYFAVKHMILILLSCLL